MLTLFAPVNFSFFLHSEAFYAEVESRISDFALRSIRHENLINITNNSRYFINAGYPAIFLLTIAYFRQLFTNF